MRMTRVLMILALFLLAMPLAAQDAPAVEGAMRLVLPDAPIAVGDTFDVQVVVSMGSQVAHGAAAYIDFDPTVFEVVRVTQNPSMPIQLQNEHDNTAGTIGYAAGKLGNEGLPSGTLTLATVTFRALAAANDATLSFSSDFGRKTDIAYAGFSLLDSAPAATFNVLQTRPADIDAPAPQPGDLLPPVGGESLTILSLPFYANLESGATNWAQAGGWSLSTDAAYAGTAGWRASAASGATAVLQLAGLLDLTAVADARLNFVSHLDAGANAYVEVRQYGSNDWVRLAQVGASDAWTGVGLDLTSVAGGLVQVRFVFDAAANPAAQWYFDELSIVEQAITPRFSAPVTGSELPALIAPAVEDEPTPPPFLNN